MKVLIISHNPTSSTNNMGKTFVSLFSSFEREELCQLYVYPTLPDADICSSYYRITDREVLGSLCLRGRPGRELSREEVNAATAGFENEKDARSFGKPNNGSAVKRILRDAMWRMSPWYTKELRAWLEREAPTCIFLAPGYARFIYDIALRISAELDIPIITYICDDYYFVKTPRGLAGRVQLSLLKKKISALMKKTSHLIAICDGIKEQYCGTFGVDGTVIMTGAAVIAEAPKKTPGANRICYFGNIGCNRYRSLADVGRALDRLKREEGISSELCIYTGENDEGVLGAFRGIESIHLCGFVSGQAYTDAVNGADLLLHTEAFDEESIDLVKNSVSTKIAESLASGIPLIAYGPAQVASMRHLINNGCAFAATSVNALCDTLIVALCNESERTRVICNAENTVREYHDTNVNSQILRETVEEL